MLAQQRDRQGSVSAASIKIGAPPAGGANGGGGVPPANGNGPVTSPAPTTVADEPAPLSETERQVKDVLSSEASRQSLFGKLPALEPTANWNMSPQIGVATLLNRLKQSISSVKVRLRFFRPPPSPHAYIDPDASLVADSQTC
jgi:hypothetical protein